MELLITAIVFVGLAFVFERRTDKKQAAEMGAYRDVRNSAQELAAQAYKLRKHRRA